MDKDLCFKTAEMEDFEEAFDFIEKLWTNNVYDKAEIKKVYQKVLDEKDSFAFFLMKNDKHIGFCHGAYFPTFWLSGDTCYVSSIITKENLRRQGYGAIIMDHVKEIAKERGCKGIVLDSAFYRTWAHEFYDKYGFEKSCYGFDLIL